MSTHIADYLHHPSSYWHHQHIDTLAACVQGAIAARAKKKMAADAARARGAVAVCVLLLLALSAAGRMQERDHALMSSVLVIDEAGPTTSTTTSGGKHLLQATAARQSTGEPEPLMQWLVDKHNELRGRHGVSALTWDWSLAWSAYDYVAACPKGHSGVQGIGENLAWGHNSFNHAMRDWYDEIQFYRFAAPSFAENTGHFSQLVWADTARIGCAANLRCAFKTWICQFTPPGNLVNYGGSVDAALWTANVPPPGQAFITGSRPDGGASFTSYDPTGESTRGLPQPRYGELKNFGYVPKPGQTVVLTDWQRFIPASVLQAHLPWAVLAAHLPADVLELLVPEGRGSNNSAAAVPKPPAGGEAPVASDAPVNAVHRAPERAFTGWQQRIPAGVIKRYVPAAVLAAYVPDGAVLAPVTPTTATTTTTPAAGGDDSSHDTKSTEADSTSASGITKVVLKPSAAALASKVAAAPHKDEPSAAAPKQHHRQRTVPPPAASRRSLLQRGGLLDRLFGGSDAGSGSAPRQPGYDGGQQQQQQPQQYGAPPPEYFAPTPSYPAQQQQQQQVAAVPLPEGMQRSPEQAAAAAAAAGAVPQASVALSPAMQDALDLHNYYRRRHGVPPLAWDPSLQASAAAAAKACPTGPSGTEGVGENIGWGFADPATATEQWYGGGAKYNFGSPGYDAAAGYFSQIVWADSRRLGCAQVLSGCSMNPVICQYHPPGNVQGIDWSTQVKPVTGAPESPPARRTAAAAGGGGGIPPVAAVPRPAYLPQAQQPVAAVPQPGGFYQQQQQAQQPVAAVPRPAPTGYEQAYATPGQPQQAQPYQTVTTTTTYYSQAAAAEQQQRSQQPARASGASAGSGRRLTASGVPVGPSISSTPRLGLPLATRRGNGSAAARPRPVKPPGQVTAAVLTPDMQAALDRHNELRARHGAPPLAWSDSIAATAQSFAAGCPQGHSGAAGLGENIAWGYPTLLASTNAWYDEVGQYDFSTPTGWSHATGHFTQLVWKDTTEVGCGVNAACAMATYVCNYAPAGNVLGVDWGAQVMAPTKAATPAAAPAPTPAPAPAPVAVPVPVQTAAPVTSSVPPTEQQGTDSDAPAWQQPAGDGAAPGTGSSDVAVPVPVSPAAAGGPGASDSITQAPQQDLPSAEPHQQQRGGAAGRAKGSRRRGRAPAAGGSRDAAAPTSDDAPSVATAALAGAVQAMNAYRATHQAPPLAWDARLAVRAQALAAGCPTGHSGDRHRGEAMAWGYPSWRSAVDAWASEAVYYSYDAPGWSAITGHFTQMVWRSTSRVGCGYAPDCAATGGPAYVCQFVPAGNDANADWSAEVLPPASAERKK